MKTYRLINIIGLVVSLTGVIVIARYLNQELTVDHYIPDYERVGLLLDNDGHSDGRNINNRPGFPEVEADEAIETFTRFTILEEMKAQTESKEKDSPSLSAIVVVAAVDSNFLSLLPRPILQGRPLSDDPQDALVSQSFADRFWPGENPIGQTFTLNEVATPLTVAGIIGEPATKSTVRFDVMINDAGQNWSRTGWLVCRLKPGATFEDFNKRQKPYMEVFSGTSYTYVHDFSLVPVASVYFDPAIGRTLGNDPIPAIGNRSSVNILMLVAALLLAIGLFNFLNIYSVVMIHRRRNFAIRRTFGAKARDFFSLIFKENMLLVASAVAIAWILILVLSPLLAKHYSVTQQSSLWFDLGLTVSITLLFPLIVSSVTSVGMWRTAKMHSMDNAESVKTIQLRRLLLIPQMIIVFILIAVSGYFMAQVRYMLTADLGFCAKDIVAFRPQKDMATSVVHGVFDSHEAFQEYLRKMNERGNQLREMVRKIRQSPLIEHCSVIGLDGNPLPLSSKDTEFGIKARRENDRNGQFQEINYMFLPKSMYELYGYQLVEGRTWNDTIETGTLDYKCLITESTKRAFGITDISRDRIQLDHRLWVSGGDDAPAQPSFEIVGVVKDFRFRHLAAPDKPLIIIYESEDVSEGKPLVRFSHENRDAALAFLQKTFAEANDGAKPEFEFIEDSLAELYRDDLRTALIYVTFAILSILVSLLGLYGVVVYDLRHRQREIRIRKVYGARLADIFSIVARPYAIAIAAASALATPLSLWIMRHYQADYSHHVAITPWYFAIALAVVVAVSLTTIHNEVRKNY